MRITAKEINAHLEKGGRALVATYTRGTLYSKKHAGWFFEKEGSLYVKHGRRANVLSFKDDLLVSIRLGQ